MLYLLLGFSLLKSRVIIVINCKASAFKITKNIFVYVRTDQMILGLFFKYIGILIRRKDIEILVLKTYIEEPGQSIIIPSILKMVLIN